MRHGILWAVIRALLEAHPPGLIGLKTESKLVEPESRLRGERMMKGCDLGSVGAGINAERVVRREVVVVDDSD